MAGGSGFRNGLANLAVQYNYTSIAVAVLLWDQIYASVPSWSSSVLSSFVFLGSIVGMLTFGYLGDVWGRPAAMGFTLALMAAGALGSAVLSWGGVYTCTLLVAAWRFVLGVGIGGVYPLSAAGAYEDDGGVAGGAAGQSTPRSAADGGSASERKARRRTRVAWALFWQQPGQMLPYLLALLLLAVAKHSGTRSFHAHIMCPLPHTFNLTCGL
jgi:PHS family inorganic phosphate transporter-like MFS transporter